MRKLLVILILFAVGFISLSTKIISNANPVNSEDSLAADRLKYMNEVLNSIKGKEKMPADMVFKNLKVMKGENTLSAEHLLWMMNWGWSKELGVSCSYCHIPGRWEDDSLRTKNIARGMWNMRVQINLDLLPKITGRDYKGNPKVTCITCHRGKPVPQN
jgi:hypothetical protein